MRHGILFFSLLVLLAGAAGGVFVLVQQGGTGQEIAEETLTANVSAGEKLEEQKAFEETSPVQLVELEKSKPSPTPTAKQVVPSPTAPKPPVPPVAAPSSSTPTSTPAPMPLPPPPSPEPAPQPSPAPASARVEKININTANLEELDQITGVGPAIAQRIVDYRNQHGPFQTIEEIKNVSGIGDVTFEKMKDEITVGDVVAPSPTPPPPPPQAPEVAKININTASYEELQKITWVGEVIAQRIIDYRVQNGPFQTIEEIKNVKGIGDATFEKMKDEITV